MAIAMAVLLPATIYAAPADDDDDLLEDEWIEEDDVDSDPSDATSEDAFETSPHRTRFIEATGAFGVQFGTTPYLPDGDGSTSHHPLTNGTAFGISAGVELVEGLLLIANFEHTSASSRDGQIDNALDKIDGVIEYRTVVVGLRSIRKLGPGRLFGELAAGVVLPFETQLQYVYAPALSGLPSPIEGAGTKTDEYNLGFGAHGALGYQLDVSGALYITAAVKLKGFATTNAGRKTRFENFVTDFTAPSPVTAEVEYQAGGMSPSTYSVQDLRLQLALGVTF